MSRTTSRQSNKSRWKLRDRQYREQQRERRQLRTRKRQARMLFDLMAKAGVWW